jgi:hypothetical protein
MKTPETKIRRDLPPTEASEFGGMLMMLYGLPRPLDRVDAIAVMPGLGEHWRVSDAVSAWNKGAGNHLLVSGINRNERTFTELTVENMSKPPINLERSNNVHTQVDADHTKHQAEWLTAQVDEHDVESMALYVSPYHILRAFRTVLKTREKTGAPRIPIIPMPVAVSPDIAIPETAVNPAMDPKDGWGMVAGELDRITTYAAKGDVATQAETQEYVSWLWQQPILAS